MRVHALSVLLLISSIYVSCSNNEDDPEGPPTNRRRFNDERVGNATAEEGEEIGEPFFDEFAVSLLNGDVSLLPPSINFPSPSINIQSGSFNDPNMTQQVQTDLNSQVSLPSRTQDSDPDAGFPFTQPSPSYSSQSSANSSSQINQVTPLNLLSNSDYDMSPSRNQPIIPPRLNSRPQDFTRSSLMLSSDEIGVDTTSEDLINPPSLHSISERFGLNFSIRGGVMRDSNRSSVGGVMRDSNRSSVGGVMMPSNSRVFLDAEDDNVMIESPRRTDNNHDWPLPAPIQSEAVIFDESEVEFFNIIQRAIIQDTPPISRYYSEFIDPESGFRRYLALPIRKVDLEEEEEQEDDEISVATQEATDDDETKEENIIDDQVGDDQNTSRYGPVSFINNSITNGLMQTPPRRQSSPINPNSSDPQVSTYNYFTPNAPITKKSYCTPPAARNTSPHYDSKSQKSTYLSPGAFVDACEVAESVFAQEVNTLGFNSVHVDFPDQILLFRNVQELANSLILEERHLRAFELDFPMFYRLVAKCPRKYFLPSLALALQYDEDFTKFLKLYFGIQNHFGPFNGVRDEFQDFFLNLFMNMTIISNSATEFFSSHKNSMFFFSDFSTFPCFYGKFSPYKVAEALSRYKAQEEETTTTATNNLLALGQEEATTTTKSNNLLKQFVLNFDYLAIINSLHTHVNFSRRNFPKVFHLQNLFSSEDDFNLAVYKLFKFCQDKTQNYANILLQRGMVRKVLKIALRFEDFDTVEYLFMNFDLEISKSNQPTLRRMSRSGIPYLSVKARKINKSFCSIKLVFKKGNNHRPVTLILPLF